MLVAVSIDLTNTDIREPVTIRENIASNDHEKVLFA